ncbi:unnamed protein product [Ectocarpus sp. CCAP 1310/34]|nr:unnamed protein product [Ectocarpus sp. CCAP 1310/34]
MDRFLPSIGGPTHAAKKTCGEPTCAMRSLLITAVHQCPCGQPMHGFCGRGIGEEGFGQQRECTDCQRRTTTGKIGTGTSPMEVNSSSDNEDNSSRTRQRAGGKESEFARKGKRPQRTAGRGGGGAAGGAAEVPRGEAAEVPRGRAQDALRAPKPVHDEVEEKLRKWIKIARARFNETKIGVSGSMIQAQALKIAAQMGKTNFKATSGWLHRFLIRYSFTHVQLHGEAGDVDKQKVAEEIERIREQLQEFDVEFILNIVETRLFFRCFPRGFEGHEGQGSVHGGRLQYDRVSDGAVGRHQHVEKTMVSRHICSQKWRSFDTRSLRPSYAEAGSKKPEFSAAATAAAAPSQTLVANGEIISLGDEAPASPETTALAPPPTPEKPATAIAAAAAPEPAAPEPSVQGGGGAGDAAALEAAPDSDGTESDIDVCGPGRRRPGDESDDDIFGLNRRGAAGLGGSDYIVRPEGHVRDHHRIAGLLPGRAGRVCVCVQDACY